MEPVKIEYQHFYTASKEPRVTVCYLRYPLHTAVGVAICSLKDRPCKKTGRGIALQRAQHADIEGAEKLPVWRTEAIEVIRQTDLGDAVMYKVGFYNNPQIRYTRAGIPL